MNVLLLLCILLPMAAAPAAGALQSMRSKNAFTVSVAALTLALTVLTQAFPSAYSAPGILMLGLTLESGGVSGVFALLAALAFLFSSMAAPAYFAGEAQTGRYQAFFLFTLGGVMGVFLAADFFTLYVFFELMSLSSWVFVAQNETPEAKKAADTYLFITIFGGLALLAGLMLLYHELGTLSFSALKELFGREALHSGNLLAALLLLLTGFGAKAGMFPLHVWLPKAHPVAPAPASALLSGILTKCGVFGILLLSLTVARGSRFYLLLLLALGVVTMLLGALLALLSLDLKRVLACSSLSQIGFILIGLAIFSTGEHTEYAASGALLHAVNHALIKSVLFLVAGVLYKSRHTLDLNELRGAGRKSPFLAGCFAVGALSIAGVPGFSGYISKTLLHEAIVEAAGAANGASAMLFSAVEWLFLLSGGLTLAYMLKLFVKLFIEKGRADAPAPRLDVLSRLAIGLPAALLLLMGFVPHAVPERIFAFAAPSLGTDAIFGHYFTWASLSGACISLAIGLILYALAVRLLLTDRVNHDYRRGALAFELEEQVYKPLLRALTFLSALISRILYSIGDWAELGLRYLVLYKAPRRIRAGEDTHFGRYSRAYVPAGRLGQTLSFELLLFGVGVVITLLYLLVHTPRY